MPLGGVPYNHVTAYIVIRTAVNLGAQDKAEYYASAMVQRQVGVGVAEEGEREGRCRGGGRGRAGFGRGVRAWARCGGGGLGGRGELRGGAVCAVSRGW